MKNAVLFGMVVAVMLVMVGTVPVFAHSAYTEQPEAIHNTVGAGLELKNLEAPIEKITPINFPSWLSLNGELKKAVATNVGYSDSFSYIEDDLGAEGWIFLTVDLNTKK